MCVCVVGGWLLTPAHNLQSLQTSPDPLQHRRCARPSVSSVCTRDISDLPSHWLVPFHYDAAAAAAAAAVTMALSDTPAWAVLRLALSTLGSPALNQHQ